MINNHIKFNPLSWVVLSILLVGMVGCERDEADLDPASFPVNPIVFDDAAAFGAGLNYAAFGGSKVTAFNVDEDVVYEGSESMRFEVPDEGDPNGGYAGGVFFTDVGRNLTGYDVLTFWARASKSATIDLIGFGNDLGASQYQASLSNVEVNTNWKKYYIPIPDASKLTQERGMLFYSEAPEEGKGYTFWLDEVQFENSGTLANTRPFMYEGEDRNVISENGATFNIPGHAIYNIPTGIDQRVDFAPGYFNLSSSDPTVATTNDAGVVTVLSEGSSTITATLGEIPAVGSLTIQSTGEPILPENTAPVPQQDPNNVISMFSDVYNNVEIDTWNTRWEFSTAEDVDLQINGDNVKRYFNLNFVGIEFASQTIDASQMTHFHIDMWTPDNTDPPAAFRILLVDFGADNTFDGGDDSSHEVAFNSPVLKTGNWVSLDIPLSSFSGLINRSNLAQLVLSGDLPNVFIDNVYFYDDGSGGGGGNTPQVAAPDPTPNPGNVLSVYSDSYNNIPGTNFNPDWGQATAVSEVTINGNNTLLYSNLNYQGTEFESAQDVSSYEFLHLDYWTNNSNLLNVFLISSGPAEIGFSLNVPTSGWGSVDIPLSAFSGVVDLSDVIQMKFDGNGDIYLDNIYFTTEGGGNSGGTEPTEAAPTPSFDPANVVSIFSDVYPDVVVDTYRTEWSEANFEEVQVDGNATLRYEMLNFVGIETVANTVDASSMTHFHVDVWSPDFEFFAIKLVDFGADGEFAGGDDVEHQIDITGLPTGEWVTLDIPLADFTGLTTTNNIAQYIFVGQPTSDNTVYLDNLFFHN